MVKLCSMRCDRRIMGTDAIGVLTFDVYVWLMIYDTMTQLHFFPPSRYIVLPEVLVVI